MKEVFSVFLFSFCFFSIAKSAGDIKDQGQNYSQNDPRTHNYAYDKTGNLIKDKQEEIEEIVWNSRGKISAIIRMPLSKKPDLYFGYDGFGNRVSKTAVYPYSINGIHKLTTYYVYDPWGKVMAVYERRYYDTGKEEYAQIEQHIYSGQTRLGIKTMNLILATEEGPVERELNKSERVLGEKKYELTNHTGNVLAVVSDKKILNPDSTYSADVVSASDYYPFGMQMPGRTISNPSDSYRYGFGGHEKDDEVSGNGNHLSFGDYGYSPRLGRRWNIDPVNQISISNYVAFKNNPIYFIDVKGEEPREGTSVLKVNVNKCFITNINDKTPKFKSFDNHLARKAKDVQASAMPIGPLPSDKTLIVDIVSMLFSVDDFAKGGSFTNETNQAHTWLAASKSSSGYEYVEFMKEGRNIRRNVTNLNEKLGVEKGFENVVTEKYTYDDNGQLVQAEFWSYKTIKNDNGEKKIMYQQISIDMKEESDATPNKSDWQEAQPSKYAPQENEDK